ncbi:T9SS type A sorting domain-containing protein [Hymenobacter cavernae]|uniref:T9SS C-terminal target domain-containing protein n=1 Tax=Hymenobacter cavernae TaxID=2044852 RepID=A0ABQ1UHL8_9BACT|nr:T9SS type A sorting domain-containing protein [Hymenobacter cavernae]GGF16589.1 hypothetical protein GCM10011383_30030 [Hymenobacter cavernae]
MPAKADSGFWKDFVIINKGGANDYYFTNYVTSNYQFNGANLGSVDRSTGTLLLNGGEANTYNTNGDAIVATRLYYTVYPVGKRPVNPSFSPVNLPRTTAEGPNSGNDRQWAATSAGINLVAAAGFVGTYTLEVYFEGDGTYPGGTFKIFDNNRNPNTNYQATFTVTNSSPPAASQLRWTGAVNSRWQEPGNWSPRQLPTRETDITIPRGLINYPELANEFEIAEVHTLQIEGVSLTDRGQVNLSAGELRVFGDFINPANGFSSTGGFFILAGTNQTVDAGLFYNLRVEGGGVKVVSTRMDVQNDLGMINGVLETRTYDPSTYGIDLRRDARLGPESMQSYVRGVIRTDRIMALGRTEGFGGIGIVVTAYGAAPGNTFVTRTTNVAFDNVGNKQGIKRSFEFRPDNNTGLNASMVFTYQDQDVTGTGVVEGNMKLFVTRQNSPAFQDLGRESINTGANTLSQNGIDALRTFTLGDGTAAPLPVALTSFTAARQGADAVLTWATAQEENNAGFQVQVSADGSSFRTLTTIKPKAPNSSTGYTYHYTDKEVGKTGTRYYRLRQLDTDGTESFYGPQAVEFADLAAAALSASPNPFSSEVTLTAQSSVRGTATLRLTDMNGRTVREQALTLEKGVSNLPIASLDGLTIGMYFVQLTLPSGEVQRLKVLKQ